VHAPQRVLREGERIERIVVPAEQGERTPAAPSRFKLFLAFRIAREVVDKATSFL